MAESDSYSAGTAYLAIEAALAEGFEADLAAKLALIKPLPISITADLEQFAKDLDKGWSDLGHTLKVQVEPIMSGKPFGEGLAPVPIEAELKTDKADAQLREFFSVVPIYEIPVVLNTAAADGQLEDLRRRAAEPITMNVNPAGQRGGQGQGFAPGMAAMHQSQADAARRVLNAAAQQEPEVASQQLLAGAARNAPDAAQQLLLNGSHQNRAAGSPYGEDTKAAALELMRQAYAQGMSQAAASRSAASGFENGPAAATVAAWARDAGLTRPPRGSTADTGSDDRSASKPDVVQKDLLARLARMQDDVERRIPLTAEGEQVRRSIRQAGSGIAGIVGSPLPEDPAAAAEHRRAAAESVGNFRSDAEKDLRSVGVDKNANGLNGLTAFFKALGSDVSFGSLLGAAPNLGGHSSWTSMLRGSGGGAGGAEAGAAGAAEGAATGLDALSAAAGPIGVVLVGFGEGLKTALGAAVEFSMKVSEVALKIGGIAFAGGLLADAGAAGLTGMFGAHNVGGALQAQDAVHEWQIDPNAQRAQQSSVISAQQGQVSAGEGVEHSQWGVEDALFGAKAAQEQLTMAQESAVLAQRSLNDAYRESARNVRDMNTALQDAKLNQEGAALAVAEARTSLLQTELSPDSTAIDRQRALWNVDYTKQRYAESKNKTSDASVDASIANQRGVNDSTPVLQATQGVQQASLGVEQAVHAQVDAGHQITAASEQIAAAAVQVQLAGLAMAQALNPTPIDDYNVALSKLSPNAQDFVKTLGAMAPDMRDLQRAVQDQLFENLGASIKKFSDDQGIAIAEATTGIAHALNTGLRDALSGVDQLFTQMQRDGTWDAFLKGVEDFAKGIAPVIVSVVDLFMTLGAKTSPIVGPLMTQLSTSITKIAGPLGDLAKSFGQALVDILPSLTDDFIAFAKTVTDSNMMDSLSQVFQELSHIFVELAPDIGPLVSALADDFMAFMKGFDKGGGTGTIKTLADGFIDLFKAVGPLMEPLGHLMATVLPLLIGYVIELIPWIEKMVPKFENWWHTAQPLVEQIGKLIDHLPGLIKASGDVLGPIAAIAGAFMDVWTAIDKVVTKFDDFVRKLTGSKKGDLTDSILHGITGMLGLNVITDLGHATGGPISGPGTGTSDSIPAMLSDGEYVINAKAAANHRPLLDSINYGAQGFAGGGAVSALSSLRNVAFIPRQLAGNPKSVIAKVASKGIRKFATGGPVKAQTWGINHPNIPYVWGYSGVDGADCSGYVGLLQQVATGIANPTKRIGVTGDVVAGTWPQLIAGASKTDPFVIGANATHMAASILGTNFEERQPGEDARIGTRATSPFDPQFTVVAHVNPQAFNPAYVADATDTTGNGGSAPDPDVAALGSTTDQTAGESALTGYKPSTWSDWAGDNTTKGIESLAQFGTLFPPLTGDAPKGPMDAFKTQLTQATSDAPADQQDWLKKFLVGLTDSGTGTGTGTGTAAPADQTPATGTGAGDGTAAAAITPPNTTAAPPSKGTDQLASEGASGGLLGAAYHALGGFSKAAGKFVSGQVSSALNVVGGSSLDNVPGWVKGAYAYNTLLISQQSLQQQTDLKNAQAALARSTQSNTPDTTTTDSAAPAPDATTSTTGGGGNSGATTAPAPNRDAHQQSSPNNDPALNHDAHSSGAWSVDPSVFSAVKGAAALYGWSTGAQWAALYQLIGNESSWNPDASAEPASDAFGLYQFLSTTWADVGGYKSSDPKVQAVYGDKYIQQRYGDPVKALAAWNSRSPHWYASGGDVSGDGSSIGDMIPAMLSNGEFVVNANAADRHRSLLHAINTDAAGSQALQLRQVIPSKGLVGAGVSRGGPDNSTTINVHAADVEQGFQRAQLYQQQRAATYTSRWR